MAGAEKRLFGGCGCKRERSAARGRSVEKNGRLILRRVGQWDEGTEYVWMVECE